MIKNLKSITSVHISKIIHPFPKNEMELTLINLYYKNKLHNTYSSYRNIKTGVRHVEANPLF